MTEVTGGVEATFSLASLVLRLSCSAITQPGLLASLN